MPYYDEANPVTVTKMNMIRRIALWLCENHCFENTASHLPQSCAAVSATTEVSHRVAQRFQLLSKSPADLRRGLRSSKIWLSQMEHLRMLLQSLRALCLAPGGSGSVWKYLEALVTLPGVSGRIACGFRTELHFADVLIDSIFIPLQNELLYYCKPCHRPTSVKRLGLNCKGEYTNANQGMMPESHNIGV